MTELEQIERRLENLERAVGTIQGLLLKLTELIGEPEDEEPELGRMVPLRTTA